MLRRLSLSWSFFKRYATRAGVLTKLYQIGDEEVFENSRGKREKGSIK
jgi:hypothetical protein